MPTVEIEAGDPIGEMEAILLAPMEIEVAELTKAVSSLSISIEIREEEMQPVNHPVLALLVESAIIKVPNEEVPVVMCLSII